MRLVEEMAFAYCGGLEEVDLPTNIDSIEEGLFADCGSLTPIPYLKRWIEWELVHFIIVMT